MSEKNPHTDIEDFANALQVFVLLLDSFQQCDTECGCHQRGELQAAAERVAAAARRLRACFSRARSEEGTL